ncbi:MAG: hypothetical protein NQU46_06775 [Methanolinea sp.]|nr:hypothetical protein [Methanolinea sp.]
MFNVEQRKAVGFAGTATGRIVSDESALIDGAGATIQTAGRQLGSCPFLNDCIGNCVPPFCTIVEMGSMLDMKEVQFASEVKSRTIAKVAIESGESSSDEPAAQVAFPVIDGPPTTLVYGIRVTGPGQAPAAVGDVMAYMNVHAQDGSPGCPGSSLAKGIDLVYKEKTTAGGYVSLFEKKMQYESGIQCH